MRRFSYLTLCCLMLVWTTACGDDDGNREFTVGTNNASTANNTSTVNNAATTTNNAATTANNASTTTNNASTTNNTTPDGVFMPSFDELDEGWNELRPGGDTVCSRGTEYAYYVYKGDPTKVVVDFFGGGACWSPTTCSVSAQLNLFSEDIEQVRGIYNAYKGGAEDIFPGIYDHNNVDNPFGDWTHVLMPYCTGDVHWGDNTVNYGPDPGNAGEDLIIEHKGAVNTRAMLDWLYAEVEAPEKIFVTGCSAGSYGAIMWAPHLMDNYPDASVYQFGDSGAGIITQTFFEDSFPSWQAEGAFPTWIPGLDPAQTDLLGLSLVDLYVGIAAYYENQTLAQFNTRVDGTQVQFYTAMGGQGGGEGWSSLMLESIDQINTAAPNFYSYTAPGSQHCVIVDNSFYTMEVEGQLLIDWLDLMVNDQEIGDVACPTCTTGN